MTALRKYVRLESAGTWRETPDSQLRDVVVGLRSATLILTDPKTEMALAQWSLPALIRLNPGQMPALYAPGAEETETLEIDDDDMAAALETVRMALERRRPRPGRLRGVLIGGFGVVTAGLVVFWLPGTLVTYTAEMLPPATRADLGAVALQDLIQLTGSPCGTKAATLASAALGLRIDPIHPPQVLVVRDALPAPIHLPGNIVVLPNALLQAADGPDAIAGAVLAETQRAAQASPTLAVLQHAGLFATLRLLGSGAIGPGAMSGYGELTLTQPPAAIANDTLLAAFRAAGISSTPYAYALDKSGETTLDLIEADPFPQGSKPPVLDDAGWLNLQAICAE